MELVNHFGNGPGRPLGVLVLVDVPRVYWVDCHSIEYMRPLVDVTHDGPHGNVFDNVTDDSPFEIGLVSGTVLKGTIQDCESHGGILQMVFRGIKEMAC